MCQLIIHRPFALAQRNVIKKWEKSKKWKKEFLLRIFGKRSRTMQTLPHRKKRSIAKKVNPLD
jgi:hypothetical protein